jgi:hypothetical protein
MTRRRVWLQSIRCLPIRPYQFLVYEPDLGCVEKAHVTVHGRPLGTLTVSAVNFGGIRGAKTRPSAHSASLSSRQRAFQSTSSLSDLRKMGQKLK